nr:hypothetical protein [Gammaproteobacteria bacterium]
MDPRSIAPAWVNVPGSQDDPTALNFANCEVPSSLVREQLALARAQFTARFQSGSPARDLIHEQALQTDQVLQRAWQRFALQGNPSLALVAVGGYGRRELH